MKALVATALLAATSPAVAALSPADLARAVARPAPGASLPAALAFTDQRGNRVTLGEIAAGAPLALVFADFNCRHICGPGLTLTATALHGTGLTAGGDYGLAVIGIDPTASPGEARMMATKITAPDVRRAASLLSGDAATIAAATRALGYRYVRDPGTGQFAHDAVVYVFGRDGRLRALLPEIGLTPTAARSALGDTAAAPPSFADTVAHLCYGFAAAHGRYGRVIVIGLQVASAALLAAMAGLLLRRRTA